MDLTPATQRPYVGSSQSDSELELALGYNGLGRLFQPIRENPFQHKRTSSTQPATPTSSLSIIQVVTSFSSLVDQIDPATQSVIVGNPSGVPGPFRLFTGPLGAQGSWLLLLSLLSLPILAWQRRWSRPQSEEVRALVLWGGWLLIVVATLSIAVHMESYYVLMLEPPVSVLSGVALTLLWRDHCRRSLEDWRGWVLPLVLLLTVLAQIHLLARYPGWSDWLTPLLLLLFAFAALGLLLARLLSVSYRVWPGLARVALLFGLLAILLAPFTWSAASLTYSNNGGFPVAGPPVATLQGTLMKFHPTLTYRSQAYTLSPEDQRLVTYLLANGDKTPFLFATLTTFNATSFILATGLPVMVLGGYSGSDHILTTSQLASLITHGTVRFFWLPFSFRPATGQFTALGGGNIGLARWLESRCTLVEYQAAPKLSHVHFTGTRVINRLYDCARIAYNGG